MTLKDDLISTPEGLRVWHHERSIFETTNLMCEIMKETGVSRTELAERLGCTKGNITQLLDGTANMTLRSVSDVFVALGRQFHPAESPLDDKQGFSVSDISAHQTTWDMASVYSTEAQFSIPILDMPNAITGGV